MTISEKKMQIVIDNYFKSECDVNTSIRQAFEKGFRIGVMKGQCSHTSVENNGEDRSKGHWIYVDDHYPISSPLYNHSYMWKSICSNCNTGFPTINKNYKFCPECGAMMKGSEE